MVKKRVTTVLVMFAMVLAMVLAGCGASEGSINSAASANDSVAVPVEEVPGEETATASEHSGIEESSSTVTEEQSAELTEDQQKLLNLIPEGAHLTFVDLPLTDTAETLSVYVSCHPNLISLFDRLEDSDYYQALEEATGVHIAVTAVSMMEADEQTKLAVAANDYCDMGNYAPYMTTTIDEAVEDGLLVNLGDYLDVMPNYSALLESNDAFQSAMYTSGGKLVGAAQYTDDLSAVYRGGPATHGEWLEKLDMEAPSTISEFTEMLRNFKNQYACESALYLPPGAMIWNPTDAWATSYLTRAFGSNNGDFYVDNGVVFSGYKSDGLKEFVATLASWYDEGLIESDYYSKDAFMTDYTNFAAGYYGVVYPFASEFSEIDSLVDGMNTVAIAEPTGDNGELFTIITSHAEWGPTYGYNITESCENPTLAAKWLDFSYSPEGWLINNYGVEGVSFEYDSSGIPHWTDVVANDPNLPAGVSKCIYIAVQNPCLMYQARETVDYTENALNAANVWSSCDDLNADVTREYPDAISLDENASSEYNAIMIDIATTVSEYIARFVTGEYNMEGDWDVFIGRLEEIGIDRCTELKQVAYDRYITQ